MALRLGDEAPNFTAETTQGTVNFHEWLGDSWGILFSHPKDFTPVCTTELGAMAKITEDFKKAFETCDVLVSPVSPTPAWKLAEKRDDPLSLYLSDILTISATWQESRVSRCRAVSARQGCPSVYRSRPPIFKRRSS